MCLRFPLDKVEDEEDDTWEATAHSVYSVVSDNEALESIFSVHYLGDDVPLLNSVDIAKHTRTDPVLIKIIHYIKESNARVKIRRERRRKMTT